MNIGAKNLNSIFDYAYKDLTKVVWKYFAFTIQFWSECNFPEPNALLTICSFEKTFSSSTFEFSFSDENECQFDPTNNPKIQSTFQKQRFCNTILLVHGQL